MEENSTLTFKMDIKFHHPVTAYALQIGGWLPPAFISAPILLVDQNVVGLINHFDGRSTRRDLVSNKWWFEFINSSQAVLNPVLCAMEGEQRRVPSFQEFRNQFDRASATLCRGFPTASIMAFSEIHYHAAYQIVENLADRYSQEVEFLLEIAPLVANRPADRVLRKVEDRVFHLARRAGIKECSLALVAVLSCIYEPRDGTRPQIGRKLLKPRTAYSEAAAHNALADLRALEMLIAANSLRGPQVAFCTRDRYLAAFWCGLRVTETQRDANSVSFRFTLGSELFPRLNDDEIGALAERMSDWSGR